MTGHIAFGEAVRHRRVNLDLTQRQLADMLGTSEQAVSEMERGVRWVSATMMRSIESALGVDFFEDPAGQLSTP